MSDMNSPSSPSSTGDEYPPLLHDNNDGDAVVVKQRQQGEDKQLNWTFLSLCAFFLLGLIWGSAVRSYFVYPLEWNGFNINFFLFFLFYYIIDIAIAIAIVIVV